MSDAATKADVLEVHRRVDGVIETVSDMRQDVGEIKGTSKQIQRSLDGITGILTKGGGHGSNSELMRTVRWLIVAVVLGGAVAAGMTSFSASSGEKTVEVKK